MSTEGGTRRNRRQTARPIGTLAHSAATRLLPVSLRADPEDEDDETENGSRRESPFGDFQQDVLCRGSGSRRVAERGAGERELGDGGQEQPARCP